MKKLTTVLCCMMFMVSGIFLAVKDIPWPGHQTINAQPPPLTWAVNGKLPLDLQLDLEKRQSTNEAPSIRDSVVLRDSVVTKVRWKTRYKTVPRAEDMVASSINPGCSMQKDSTLVREEQTKDSIVSPKETLIQLSVDGQIVYSSENDNHSGVRGQ